MNKMSPSEIKEIITSKLVARGCEPIRIDCRSYIFTFRLEGCVKIGHFWRGISKKALIEKLEKPFEYMCSSYPS